MKYRLVLSCFFAVFSSLIFAQSAWTLQQCIEYAIGNNIQIIESEVNEKMAKNNLLQSQLNLLPNLSGSTSYNFTFGYSVNPVDYQYSKQNSEQFQAGINSSFTLINGLQKVNTIHKNKADLQAAGFDKQNTIQTTTLNLTNYFLQVLLNKELLGVAQSQYEISQSQLAQSRSKLKTGTLSESEIYQFESQEASNNAAVIQAQNNLALSLVQLKIALQLPDSTAFDVAVPNITDDMLTDISQQNENDLYNEALYHQPSVKSAQAKIASAIYSHKIALGTLSPTISFNFTMSSYYYNQAKNTISLVPLVQEPIPFKTQMHNQFQQVASFSLQLPIFQGWSRMNNIENTKLQRQIQELELNKIKNQFRQDIQQAFNNAKYARESFFANEKAAVSAQKSYDAYNKRFTVGMANAFELQQAQTNLYKAESQAAQSKYQYLLYLKILDYYQGKAIRIE